ncbi:MAG TPA: DUF4340 domain-containing protein [Spirochaetia bacterium]|nr:DUF4340 domain-containing protein [Spirochaetia bacterium]
MEFRRKVSVLGALIGMLTVALIAGVAFSAQYRGIAEANQPLLPSVRPDLVNAIEIEDRSSADAVTVVRLSRPAGGNWEVMTGDESYPADSSKVRTFLSDLANLQSTRTVTTNPALYKEFQLDDAQASTVTLTAAHGSKVSVYYGKDALEGGYVRIGNDPTVYLGNKSLSFYVNRVAHSWYYLRLLPASISNINIQSAQVDFLPGATAEELSLVKEPDRVDDRLPAAVRTSGYRLVRRATDGNPNAWFYERDLTISLDQAQVESTVREMIMLEGVNFAAATVSESEAGVKNPGIRLTITTGEGREYSLAIGHSATKDTFYVLPGGAGVETDKAGRPYIYVVSRYYLERALTPISSLESKRATAGGAPSSNGSSN